VDGRSVAAHSALMRRSSVLLFALAITATTAAVVVACSSSRAREAGTPDAGTPETGTDDARADDAGTSDVGIPDSGTTDAFIDDGICSQSCQIGIQAGCDSDNAACLAMCQQDFARGVCNPEKRVAQLCVIAVGPDAITCMNGRSFVKAGICPQERQALMACLTGTGGSAARN
jgi:hypothetical protein